VWSSSGSSSSGGGDGGGTPAQQQPSQQKPQPPAKPRATCTIPRLAIAAKGLVNLGVGTTKIRLAAVSAISAPVTGPVGVAGAIYGAIGAAGNITAGGLQLAGAITGNVSQANAGANVLTTVTTLGGFTVLAATRGNLEAASAAANFESLGTAGVNGGMTGHLIDEGATFTQRLLLSAELGQNTAEAAGISTDGSCQ
jgi:hypothetical protein